MVHKGGRPRDAQADLAILDATTQLLIEGGFGRLSVDAVAARAGVGKATIYRRWRTKSALLHATLARIEETPDVADTGHLHGDLRAMLAWLVEHFVHSDAADLMPLLVTEARFDQELRELRHSVAAQGRGVVRQILERAERRGELRDDLGDLDFEVAVDMLISPIFIRKLVTDAAVDTRATDAAVDMVVRGILREP